MSFLDKLFGNKSGGSSAGTATATARKPLPVSGGHVDKDEPLYCPRCRDRKRDTTPRFAVFVCNKCRATVTIDNYIVRS
jgi:hypothetical protein